MPGHGGQPRLHDWISTEGPLPLEEEKCSSKQRNNRETRKREKDEFTISLVTFYVRFCV